MKRIVVLLMICMLLFSISACSDESASSGSQSSINNGTVTSDVISSVDDDTASSEVSSTRPTISYEGTNLTPPDKTVEPVKPTTSVYSSPYLAGSDIGLSLSYVATTELKEITEESLSDLLGIEIDAIQAIEYREKDNDKSKKYAFVRFTVKHTDPKEITDLCTRLEDHKHVMHIYSRYHVFTN